MNKENKPIDKETKAMLLSVLQKGYFSQEDIDTINKYVGRIDPFAQMRKNHNIDN